jgi:hypothetical protein
VAGAANNARQMDSKRRNRPSHLLSLMGRKGAEVIEGHTRDEMIAKAKQYIDGLR